MKKLILLLAAVVAFGQTPAPGPLAGFEVVRVIEVRNADPASIANTLNVMMPGISLNGRMLVVRGSESVVTMVEDAVKKLDIAPPPPRETQRAVNVELTFQLVYGSAQEASNTIPSDLEATVRQLRALFPYKNYRVLDTQVLRGRDGAGVEFSGTLPGSESVYTLKYTPRVSPGAAPRSVRAQHLEFGARMRMFTNPEKTQFQYIPTGIITDVDAREGQKTVVGKSNVTGTDDAIILVITAKVIE
jgi:hypothetical protein